MSTRIVLPLSCIEETMAIIIVSGGGQGDGMFRHFRPLYKGTLTANVNFESRARESASRRRAGRPNRVWIPTITINKELIMPKTTPEQNKALVRRYPESGSADFPVMLSLHRSGSTEVEI